MVKYDDVAHRGSGGAPPDLCPFHQREAHGVSREGKGTGGTDNPAAYDDCVEGMGHRPQQKVSRGSRMRVDSEVIKAVPVMLGITFLSCNRTWPSKTLPMMLSCRQTSPGARSPSA